MWKRLVWVVFAVGLVSCQPEPGDDTVVIPAAGGEIVLSPTITLIVPAGAVAQDTPLSFQSMSAAELVDLFPHRGLDAAGILGCFNLPGTHIQFSRAVTVRITNITDVPGALPVVHHFDTGTGEYRPYEADYRYWPSAGIIEIDVDHFTGVSVEVQEQARDALDSEDPCRNGAIHVEQRDEGYLCSAGSCQIMQSSLKVTFLECGTAGNPLVETCWFREVGPGCRPVLQLTASPAEVDPGASAVITATLKLGCEPLEGKTVFFAVTGVGSLSETVAQTNGNGQCSVTFNAGDEEGTATVLGNSSFTWHTSEIRVDTAEGTEISLGPSRDAQPEGSTTVTVKAGDPWQGQLTMTYSPVSYYHDLYSDLNMYPDVYSWSGGTVTVDFTFNPADQYYSEGEYWIEGQGTATITGCEFSTNGTSFSWDDLDGDGDGAVSTLDLSCTYDVHNSEPIPALVAFVSADGLNYLLAPATTLDYFNEWSVSAHEYVASIDNGETTVIWDRTVTSDSFHDFFWIGDGPRAFPITAGTTSAGFTNASEPYASIEPQRFIYFIEPMSEPTHGYSLTLTPPE